MGNEKVGVDAVFANADFQKGLAQFTKGLQSAVSATESATGSMDASMSRAGGSMGSMASSSILAGVTLGTLAAGAIQAVIKAVGSLIMKLTELASTFISFGIESTKTAGRFNELAIVARVVGANVGMSAEEVEAATQSVVEMGIQTDVASKAVITFARFNLDMAKASDLARVAQDAAVISMSDSSQTLDRLIFGIQTFNVRILRTAGIVVNSKDAFEAFAKANDIAVEAMGNTEKQAAFLNAVIESGTAIAKSYEAAMLSPAKRLRSMTRHINELKNAIGQPFQDAFLQAVFIMEDFTKGLRSAVEQGGVLYDVLRKLGATMAVILEGLRGFLNSARTELEKFGPAVIETFTDLAFRALSWGVNVAGQFAIGLIQGAATAITAAMNFISSLLSFWLSPGSPPKVAPNLDLWGAQAFEEFLKGMTDANLGPLKELQKLIADKIGSKNLLELELDLIKATDRLRDAEGKLDDSRKTRIAGQKQLSKLVANHNRLLAQGVSDTQLKQSLEAINAQESLINGAATEEDLLVRKVDLAKEEVSITKEQIGLQRKLIQQISKLMATLKGGLTGGEGGGLLDDILGDLNMPDITPLKELIDTAFDELKASIKEKFKEMFKPLTDAWTEHVTPKLLEMEEQWGVFTKAIDDFYKEHIEPITDKLSKFFPDGFWTEFARFTGALIGGAIVALILVGALLALKFILFTILLPLIALFLVWKLLVATWETLKKTYDEDIKPLFEQLGWIIGKVARIIVDKIIKAFKDFKQLVIDLKLKAKLLGEQLRDKLASAVLFMKGKMDDARRAIARVKAIIGNTITKIGDLIRKFLSVNLPWWMTPGSATPWETGLIGINKALSELTSNELPALEKELNLTSIPVSANGAGGSSGNTINNNQQTNQEINITNPQQSNQSIADDIIFANALGV